MSAAHSPCAAHAPPATRVSAVTRCAGLFAGAALLGACSLAPTYEPPRMTAASAYQEAGDWVEVHAAPPAPPGAWWGSFRDTQLNQLEAQAQGANQNLLAAAARLMQARDIARAQNAELFPQVSADASHQNGRISSNKPLFPPGINTGYQDNTTGLNINYEIDLWGALRNASTAAAALAQASADDLAALRLSTQAELATDYFNLQATDVQIDLLQHVTGNWRENKQLTEKMMEQGFATESDIDLAQLSLQNTSAQLFALQGQRKQLEHAIALIVGANPDTFALPAAHAFDAQPLQPEVGLPSTLLERRPDIASAERAVMAANAQIGVARAAFFPVFSLNAATGYESKSAAGWLNAPNRFWSVGPALGLNLFNGGQLQALSDLARAQWEESAARYRNTVLTAWREVEDGLSSQHALKQALGSAQQAMSAAQAAQQQAQYRYAGGLGNQIEVLQSERITLSANTAQIELQRQNVINSIGLVKALGGDMTRGTPAR